MVFNCDSCSQSITVPDAWAGRKGRCPKCRNVTAIPHPESAKDDSPDIEIDNSFPDLTVTAEKNDDSCIFDFVAEEAYKRAADSHIEESERIGSISSSWFVEMLRYPTNSAGLAMLTVFILAPTIWQLSRLLFNVFPGNTKLLLIPLLVFAFAANVIVTVYMFWYFSLCIQQSALGSAKAPETLMNDSSFWEMFCKMVRFFSCVLLCLGLAARYYYQNMQLDTAFFSILAAGVFFLPMTLLTTSIFDSLAGLNPICIVRSITILFRRYIGVALIYCVFVGLVALPEFILLTEAPGPLKILFHGVFAYCLMMTGHILGRLYYRNSEKLNWQV